MASTANSDGGGKLYTYQRSQGWAAEDEVPAPTPTAAPSPALNTGTPMTAGSDASTGQAIQSIIDEFKAGQLGTGGVGDKSKRPSIVPLWRVRPAIGSTYDSGLGKYRREMGHGKANKTDAEQYRELMVNEEQASRAYLDMSPADRKALKDKLVALGLIKPTDDEGAVMNEWMHWVGVALDYNTGREESEYISPWEALDKLALGVVVAGEGGAAGDDVYKGPTDETDTVYQTFTLAEIKAAAEQTLLQTLGRGATKGELDRYLKAINDAAQANPKVTRTVGSAVKADGTRDTTTYVSGGLDAQAQAAVLSDLARQNPEYAPVQAATTYFEAAMAALNAVASL